MDRLDAMQVLVTVVQEGSLSAAARRLRAPLPTVSRKVADLERHLNARLIVRTSRRVELTEAGRDYVAAATRIIEQVEEAEQAASGEYREPRGELVVTATHTFGQLHVVPLMADFLGEFPNIDLRLLLADRVVNLVEEHVHVAVRLGQLTDSSLTAVRIGAAAILTCASGAYLQRRGVPRTPEEMRDHDGIAMQGLPPLPWTYQREGAAVVAEPRDRLTVNSGRAAVEAALAGAGIVRAMSYQVAGELRSGALVQLLAEFEPPPAPLSLVHASQGMVPLKLRAFLNWIGPRLRARLA